MATIIDALVVELGLDTKKFAQGQKDAAAALTKTKDVAVKSSKEIEAAGDKAAESLVGIGKAALAMFAIFAGFSGIKDFISQITSADAALGRLAKNLGTTPDAISAITSAVERQGGSADAAAASLQAYSDSIQEVKTSGSSGILTDLYRLQGLGGKTINFKADDKGLRDIADNLQKVAQTDLPLANFMGRKILGDPGLVNLAEGGRGAIDRAEAESRKHGVPTSQDIDAATKLQAAWKNIRQSTESLGRTLTTDVSPAVTDLLTQFDDWLDQARNSQAMKDIGAQIRGFVDYLKTLPWAKIGQDVKAFASNANDAAQAVGGWKNVIEDLFELWLGAKFLKVLANIGLMRMAFLGGATGGGLFATLGAVMSSLPAVVAGAFLGSTKPANAGEPEVGSDGFITYPDGHRERARQWDGKSGPGANPNRPDRAGADTRSWWQKTLDWGKGKLGLGDKTAPGAGPGAAGVDINTKLSNLDAKQQDDFVAAMAKSEGNPGARPDYNNPGNIKYGKWAADHGATGGGMAGIAQFPDATTGNAALRSLVFGKSYRDLSIAKAMQKYAPAGDGANDPDAKARFIASRIGAPQPTQAAAAAPALLAPAAGDDGVDKDISGQSNYDHGQLAETKGFVFHHTAGRETPEGLVAELNQKKLGIQYVIDRDGKIIRTLPDGARGAHILPSQINDLNNGNTQGAEVIAKDDKDVTPAQLAAGKRLAAIMQKRYPGIQFFGHGELNPGHRQATEGMTIVSAIRNGAPAPATDPNYKPAPIPMEQRTLAGYMGRELGVGSAEAKEAPPKAMLPILSGDQPGAERGSSPLARAIKQYYGAGGGAMQPGAMKMAPEHFQSFVNMAKTAQASVHHHLDRSITNTSTSNESHIGQVIVNTSATDASGIARDIGPHLQRQAFATQANYGPA